MPKEFFDDFIKVACDEAKVSNQLYCSINIKHAYHSMLKHFRLLEKRLHELNSHFGALPVHNGLWQSASDTKTDLLSRLAIIHMVHEAR